MLLYNKYDTKYDDHGFTPIDYPRVLVVPYIHFTEKYHDKVKGYQQTIYTHCVNALKEKGFQIIDESLFYECIKQNNLKITIEPETSAYEHNLLFDTLKSKDNITMLGKKLGADCVMAHRIILNSGDLFRTMYVEMETYAFDAKTAKVIWYSWGQVKHGNAGPYKIKVFENLFKRFFKSIKTK
jgi:hypothetical protein